MLKISKSTKIFLQYFFSSLQVDDFIESIEKFVTTLSMARGHMSDRFELDEVDIGYNLDDLKGPQDFMQAASTNTDLIEKIEEVLTGWCKQIDQVCLAFFCLRIFRDAFLNSFSFFAMQCYRQTFY